MGLAMTRCGLRRLGLPTLGWVLTTALAGGCAARQPLHSFADLPQRISPGHTVYVIDDAGLETRGQVVSLSPSELTLRVDGQPRSMSAPRIRQVQRYGDSVWNGLAIGAAVALPGMLISDPRYVPCRNDPQRTCSDNEIAQRVMGAALVAAVGAGIDALIRGRDQVYVAPGPISRAARRVVVSPRITDAGAGLTVSIHLTR